MADELPLVPLPTTVTDERPSDLDRVAARHLTLAPAAAAQLHAGSHSRRRTGRWLGDATGSYAIGPTAHGSA